MNKIYFQKLTKRNQKKTIVNLLINNKNVPKYMYVYFLKHFNIVLPKNVTNDFLKKVYNIINLTRSNIVTEIRKIDPSFVDKINKKNMTKQQLINAYINYLKQQKSKPLPKPPKTPFKPLPKIPSKPLPIYNVDEFELDDDDDFTEADFSDKIDRNLDFYKDVENVDDNIDIIDEKPFNRDDIKDEELLKVVDHFRINNFIPGKYNEITIKWTDNNSKKNRTKSFTVNKHINSELEYYKTLLNAIRSSGYSFILEYINVKIPKDKKLKKTKQSKKYKISTNLEKVFSSVEVDKNAPIYKKVEESREIEEDDYIIGTSSKGTVSSGSKFGSIVVKDIKYAKFFYQIHSNDEYIPSDKYKSCVHYALIQTFNNKNDKHNLATCIDYMDKNDKYILTVDELTNLLEKNRLNFKLFDSSFAIHKEYTWNKKNKVLYGIISNEHLYITTKSEINTLKKNKFRKQKKNDVVDVVFINNDKCNDLILDKIEGNGNFISSVNCECGVSNSNIFSKFMLSDNGIHKMKNNDNLDYIMYINNDKEDIHLYKFMYNFHKDILKVNNYSNFSIYSLFYEACSKYNLYSTYTNIFSNPKPILYNKPAKLIFPKNIKKTWFKYYDYHTIDKNKAYYSSFKKIDKIPIFNSSTHFIKFNRDDHVFSKYNFYYVTSSNCKYFLHNNEWIVGYQLIDKNIYDNVEITKYIVPELKESPFTSIINAIEKYGNDNDNKAFYEIILRFCGCMNNTSPSDTTKKLSSMTFDKYEASKFQNSQDHFVQHVNVGNRVLYVIYDIYDNKQIYKGNLLPLLYYIYGILHSKLSNQYKKLINYYGDDNIILARIYTDSLGFYVRRGESVFVQKPKYVLKTHEKVYEGFKYEIKKHIEIYKNIKYVVEKKPSGNMMPLRIYKGKYNVIDLVDIKDININHTYGNLLIEAYAGTGKTYFVLNTILKMIDESNKINNDDKVDLNEILDKPEEVIQDELDKGTPSMNKIIDEIIEENKYIIIGPTYKSLCDYFDLGIHARCSQLYVNFPERFKDLSEYNYLILEECANISHTFYDQLYSRIQSNQRIICLGDPNQLNPVGEDITVLNSELFKDIFQYKALLNKNMRNGFFIKEYDDQINGTYVYPAYIKNLLDNINEYNICYFNKTKDYIHKEIVKHWEKRKLKRGKVGNFSIIKGAKFICSNNIYFSKLINKDDVVQEIKKIKNKHFYNEMIYNCEPFIVSSWTNDTVTLENDNRIITIKSNIFCKKFFDYNYCITLHKIQGSSIPYDTLGIFDYKYISENIKGGLYTLLSRILDTNARDQNVKLLEEYDTYKYNKQIKEISLYYNINEYSLYLFLRRCDSDKYRHLFDKFILEGKGNKHRINLFIEDNELSFQLYEKQEDEFELSYGNQFNNLNGKYLNILKTIIDIGIKNM